MVWAATVPPKIDARVDATRDFLFGNYPGTRDLAQKAYGVLYMPLVTEAGFGIGGGLRSRRVAHQ